MNKQHHMWPTLIVGFIAGTAAGFVGSSMTSDRSRRKVRRQAEHAMRTMSDLAKDVSQSIR